ncbi:CHAT domain-containing protein [Haliscomenobacter hydrossis]|uniref:Tetratricopeptide TPR_1 repeat-containing protein n=1 Tax=Haliscomenobacter hydrossis (strain ATCC 27775 / DSM 1100 / LMG 10767 / O) TaxID=760192 RepID=F4L6Q6_HALH1|nr:CHAT domain-containing tetratricopeptide repeat protein [Haliscomenobacter hydrossis]AEE50887.1 Tetratricopeptide TPR_1 repeat-containing protein [Haliscomenobacter hydrossis DSM 1100]
MFFRRHLFLLAFIFLSFHPSPRQDSLELFRSRNQLADYLRFNWDRQNELDTPAVALAILDETLRSLWRAPKNAAEAEELLWVQLSRADYLFQLGKVLESVQAYEEALRWHRRYTFPDMVEYLYKPLIAHYTRLGENEKARVLYERAFKEASPESLAGLYNNLGLTYWNEGRNQEALGYFAKGLQLGSLEDMQKGLLWLSEARSQFELGENVKAALLLKKSLKTLEAIPEKEADVLDYLAGAYALQGVMQREAGAYAPAEAALARALQLVRKVYGIQHREYGKINVEYAYLFLKKGHPEQAIRYFDAALQAVIPGFKPKIPTDLPNAKQLYEENTIYEALAGKADALAQLYQQNQRLNYLTSAFSCHQLAQQVELSLRHTLQFESSKLSLLAYSRKRMEAALAIAFELYQKNQDPKTIRAAWTMVEQNKAAVLLEAVQENRLKQAMDRGDTLLLKEVRLKKQIAWFDGAALNANDAILAQNYQRQANQTRDDLAELKIQLAKKYPAYARYKQQLSELDLEKIRQRLLQKNGSLALEYFAGEAQTYLFSMPAQGQLKWVKIGSSARLSTQVRKMREWIQDKTGGDLQAYQQFSQQLFELLLPDGSIPVQTRSVVLIPDAWLSTLPFETLVEGKKTATRWSQVPYWCHKITIQYGYSLGVLLSQQDLQPPQRSRLLAIAPEFTKAERGLAPLSKSKAEVQQIKGIAKKAFFNTEATWQHFAKKAPHYSILHLATHASADSVRNAAGVEFYERRAFLSDIYALPLHADLICLSACQSGLGEWRDGEGVMSLARAFAYAGSKGLVATLWSVNEASSSVLFQSFYTHLRQGMSKAAALNQAKQDYLNNPAIPTFQKTPYYWAALTYVGEDSVVRMENHTAMIWIWGGIGVLALGLGLYFYQKKKN